VRQEQQNKEMMAGSQDEGTKEETNEGQENMEISGEPGARLEQVLEETISMDRSTPSEAIVSESGLSQLVLDSVVVADCGLETVDDLELGEDDQLAAAIQLSMQAMGMLNMINILLLFVVAYYTGYFFCRGFWNCCY
jgi:hypothetical protein